MAYANLPSPQLTAAERDDIVTKLGGEEAYVAWLSEVLTGELERRAATAAREAVNVTVRDAVQAVSADLPASLNRDTAAAADESRA